MRKTQVVCLALILVSFSAFAQRRTETINGRQAIASQVIVKLRSPSPALIAALQLLLDADPARQIGGIAGPHVFRSRSQGVQRLLAILASRTDLLFAEPDYILQSSAVPTDPNFNLLWGLKNTSTFGADISAVPAWDISTGSTQNVVGVVDTGISYTHPDLAANVWTAPTSFTVNLGSGSVTCAAGSHGYNAITRVCDPADDHGHGTHVSGTIGAVGNNTVGVVGVNWTTRIMGIKFLDSTGNGSTSDAIDGIEFAIQVKSLFSTTATPVNVRVLSNSWGGSGFSQALLDEINKANSSSMLFVAAAGNSGVNIDASPTYPASFHAPNLIAVAATDISDGLAGFSNYSPSSVHLGAPGVTIYSTYTGGTYAYLSGTSMATPHVSGAATLVLSACNLTTAGLKSALLNNTDLIPSLAGKTATGGRLNVNKAIRSCIAPSPPTLTCASSTGQVGQAYTSALTASAGLPPYTYSIQSGALPSGLNLSSTTGAIVGTPAASGNFSYTAKVVDSVNSSATNNCSLNISPQSSSSGVSIWRNSVTPGTAYATNPPVNVGLKFRSDINGFITGMRFYKGVENNGAHTASLYTSAGTLLAQATFSGETASGWQQVNFPSPVSIGANTTYVASLFTTSGFAYDYGYFTGKGVDNAPLRALASGVDGGNGVYTYGSSPEFPWKTYGDANYWVDVTFATSGTAPPVALACPSGSGLVGAVYNSGLVASGGVSPYTYSITSGSLPVGLNLNSSLGSIAGMPSASGNFSFTAQALDSAGNSASSSCSIGISAAASSVSIWSNSVTPGTAYATNPPVNVGLKFRSDINGFITGMRFYKGVENNGAHTASLYTSAGTLLAQATFSAETASGWQQVNFPSPVSIGANTTYVASLFTTSGFAYDYGYFTGKGVDNAPLHALASGVDGGNGVYAYGSSPQLPWATYGRLQSGPRETVRRVEKKGKGRRLMEHPAFETQLRLPTSGLSALHPTECSKEFQFRPSVTSGATRRTALVIAQ